MLGDQCRVIQISMIVIKIDSVACGPTQMISFRPYEGILNLQLFDGNGLMSILVDPGDVYILRNQI